MTTKAGNTLDFFYNPENNLVVVDLISKNEQDGNEILRMTLNEKSLLRHCKDTAPEITEAPLVPKHLDPHLTAGGND